MDRIKDYAGFIGWFAGLGYIVMWPITAADLAGKPFGHTIFCLDGSAGLVDYLCNSTHPLQLPAGLHLLGFMSAIFVTMRLLVHTIGRSRRRARANVAVAAALAARMAAAPPQAKRPIGPPRRPPIKARAHFGLRGVARKENETVA
jgi:hypothetical protein